MAQELISRVVILGGGTAGWMTAAALSRTLNGRVAITLVESSQIGTVGVGEATIPGILRFNDLLGIPESEFLAETRGTIKLGIEFVDWAYLGHRYMHGFGRLRSEVQIAPFEQLWLKMHLCGRADDLRAYSMTKAAAYAGKFMHPRLDVPESPLADIAYAFHFDASLYAAYLRRYAELRGVVRVEGQVAGVLRADGAGDLYGLRLEDGHEIAGDFFVDCSGFRGRLIEDELHAGYEDWSHWLPCDRAFAVPCESVSPITPFTRATARSAGWQWRIPLQHRIGNGYVFSSRHVSEDEARATLLANLDGRALAEPSLLRFVTGLRKKAWIRNCVAIGLSSGFLEPLESTSISLIQSSILKLLNFFPTRNISQPDIDEYNRLVRREFEHVRDFVMLHYHAQQRTDAPLWNDCRSMSIPDSLANKLRLFATHGRLVSDPEQLFAYGSWFQVLVGQGRTPAGYDPIVDVVDVQDLEVYFRRIRDAIRQCVQVMPTHEAFLAARR